MAFYRFGFLCFPIAEQPSGAEHNAILSKWRKRQHGELLILTHPETPVFENDNSILIGHCFSLHPNQSVGDLVGSLNRGRSEAINSLSGRFALLLSNGRVYHDAIGSRSIFYRVDGSFGIASHCTLLAELFGDGPDPLAAAIKDNDGFRNRSVKYLPGDLSIHSNIRALPPNNFYDVCSRRIVRYWPLHQRQPSSLAEFYRCADCYFDAFADFLRLRFSPVLGITAGIDSRCIISGLRRRAVPMRFVTWTDYNFPESDLPVVNALVAYLNGQHVFLRGGEKRDDKEFLQIIESAKKNAGHFRGISGISITASMKKAFPGEGHVFVRGYGGEILRGFYNLHKRPIQTPSVPELVKAYNYCRLRKIRPSAHYLSLVSRAVEQFMLRAGYEGLDQFGFDINDIYYWEQRMGMWGSAMQNEMDPAMHSLVGYNSRSLYEAAFGLEPRERLTKNLLVGLTRRYDPQLSDIPVN